MRLFNGERQPIAQDCSYLLRILDGSHEQVYSQDLKGMAGVRVAVPLHDNLDDRYTVLVSSKGCADAGFYPVIVTAAGDAVVDLMIVRKPAVFDFARADWDRIETEWPAARRALAFGATASAARARYDRLLKQPLKAAALWNILTAMRDAQLPQGTPLDYLREIIWDGELAPTQDRFFAFASIDLLDQMKIAMQQGAFVIEPNPAMFHTGATSSFKQAAFGEANLQVTFHGGVTKKVDGETWVRIEPDIDYFKDLGAHALLEVLPHKLTGSKTDPAAVYVLRWIAGRHAGVPEFDPPYVISA